MSQYEREDEIEILEIVGLDEDGEEITFDEGEEEAAGDSGQDAPEQDGERYLRLRADFENLKKRSEREIAEQRRYASAALVERLLPVLDNFERALAAGAESDGDESFRRGVELIYKQLMDELKKEGLHLLESEGEPFDPSLHEAVETCRVAEHPPNTVIRELLRGYRFLDRLIRPALVKVNLECGENGPPEGADGASDG